MVEPLLRSGERTLPSAWFIEADVVVGGLGRLEHLAVAVVLQRVAVRLCGGTASKSARRGDTRRGESKPPPFRCGRRGCP
jgi:hypothetical protein